MDQYNPWGDPQPRRADPRWKEFRNRWSGPLIIGVLLALLVLWILTGFYSVGPGEVAVVRQFGKVVNVTQPGLHLRLPYPIQTHNIVNVEQQRRAEIGFRSERQRGLSPGPRHDEALMLTSDENIVEVHMVVQYRVQEPVDFLFNVRDPEDTLHAAAQVALRNVVGANSIDAIITAGAERTRHRFEVQEQLQEMLDTYGTGLRVIEVNFTLADAPEQVRDAFHDVLRALEERERKVNEAMAYAADVVPRARGEAAQIINQAEAFREERVSRARGEANRYLQMLAEYKEAPEVTRQRMYLEAVESVLSGTDMYVVSGGAADSLLPLLPLGSLEGGR